MSKEGRHNVFRLAWNSLLEDCDVIMIASVINYVCGSYGNRILLAEHFGGSTMADRMLIAYRNAFSLLQHSFGRATELH